MFEAVVVALRRRGIGLHAAEDATQEAGSRVLANGIRFVDADDLRRWVQTVAWRVAIDESRRQARYDGGGTAVDAASGQEVAAEVEHRLRLAATSKAWRTLSAADREAIIGEVDGVRPLTRKEAVRMNVRRHRARARLLAMIEGVAGVVTFPFRRARKLTAAAAVAAALPITALVLPFVDDHPGPAGSGAGQGAGPAGDRGVADISPAVAVAAAAVVAALDAEDGAGATSDPAAGFRGAPAHYPSALDRIDAHVDTPMPDEQDPHLKSKPKEQGQPIACAWPTGTRVCTPDLPVTVPAPPDPTGQL